ncbi:hypothetical protein Bca4012_079532 [Brassica carinata]
MVLIYVKSGEPAVVSLSSRDVHIKKEFLARRINSRLTPKEREELYMKWDVPLEGKQRKLQFVNKLWTDPYDSRHVQESAEIVAKLVGFSESGNISKEMFELNFAMPSDKKWNNVWDNIYNLLHL